MRTRLPVFLVGLLVAVCATAEPAATSGGQSQTSVQSQRAELYPRVTKFLVEAAALEPAFLSPRLDYPQRGLIPGWRDRICPQVTGLPRQQGEFVLARLSEIARTVGVRTDAAHCAPNIYVFVTAEPNEVLRKLEKHDSYDTFGPRGFPYLLDQFAAMPQPVRVWYNIYGRGTAITKVLVIVDKTRVQEATMGQLADYLAMVSFAEIRPDAQLDDAPTILTLFAGAPKAAPPGLSNWDQAFLTSLYTHSWANPWRRELERTDQLALSMVSEIVP
jgi:hypothetical protein